MRIYGWFSSSECYLVHRLHEYVLFTLCDDGCLCICILLRVCLTRVVLLSLNSRRRSDSSRSHQRRELACRSAQSGHTRPRHRGKISLSSSPSFFLVLGLCDSSWFHFAAPLHPPPNSPPLPPPPQWVYLSFHSPVSFLRSLSFPFLPGSVNDLILMKHSLGGETKPHGWNLPPFISLNHPVLQNLAFIPNANRTDREVWEF